MCVCVEDCLRPRPSPDNEIESPSSSHFLCITQTGGPSAPSPLFSRQNTEKGMPGSRCEEGIFKNLNERPTNGISADPTVGMNVLGYALERSLLSK